MNYRFLVPMFLLVSCFLGAQNFQKTLSNNSTDFNHYSIETTTSGDYILAGTRFEPGNNRIHVMRMDVNGNVLCEQTLDLSPDDRALDITEGPNGELVVTGYTTMSGFPELLISRFDPGCNCDQTRVVGGYDATAGTNIIWSFNNQTYVVGGLSSDVGFSYPLMNNRALVLEFDPTNLTLGTVVELNGPDWMHSSVNDIVEVPSGFFVTGSIDDNSPLQGVLAVILDGGLNLTNNISFESTNSEHVGVSAVYDQNNDEIWLMSNNSAVHNPQITQIVGVSSGAPVTGGHYYLALDPNLGSYNAAGFDLHESIYDPNNLVAAGYFRTFNTVNGNDNATPWIVEFEKSSGANVQSMVYNPASTNFHTHDGSIFSTFSGEHPYVFNQEIMTYRPDGDGYVIMAPRLMGGQFCADVVSTDFNPGASVCLDAYSYNAYNLNQTDILVADNYPGLPNALQGPGCAPDPVAVTDECGGGGGGNPCNPINFQRTVELNSTDHNHYSIEKIEDCDYILAGTEFRPSGDNDIHIFRMDENGAILWEKYINLGSDDRALDVVVDPNDEIVVVGYTNRYGNERMYMVKLDPSGNCLADYTLQTYPFSSATNVIYSANTGNYVVGGMRAGNFVYPLTDSRAVVLEMNNSLTPTGNITDYFGNTERHASVNDIVEIPGGYFVTGSMSFNNQQGVLAMFLDNNLNGVGNNSFESTNSEHAGVSAVFDSSTDQIFLMSNNSVIHNPQITIIDNISGARTIGGHYYLELDPSYGGINAAGFQLEMSVTNPSTNLVAAGYFRTYSGTIGGTNATCWVAEFDRNGGANVQTVLYEVPSSNFHTHGGGLFSTFSGEHPYIFNQEILEPRPDNQGYVFVAPREINGFFAVDVVSSVLSPTVNSCLSSYNWDNYGEFHVAITPSGSTPGYSGFSPNAGCNVEGSQLSVQCNVTPKVGDEIDAEDEMAFEGLSIFPNPTTDRFNVQIENPSEAGELVVLNTLGKVIFTQRVTADEQALTFDLSDHQTGIYFVIYTDDNQRVVSKVMKR